MYIITNIELRRKLDQLKKKINETGIMDVTGEEIDLFIEHIEFFDKNGSPRTSFDRAKPR